MDKYKYMFRTIKLMYEANTNDKFIYMQDAQSLLQSLVDH